MSGKFEFKIEKLTDQTGKIAKALGSHSQSGVLVGIPEAETGRTDGGESKGPINNATLAYIHENGSERANIPPRRFMLPGINKVKAEIARHLSSAGAAAIEGDEGAVDREFNKAGQTAVNSIRGMFVDNDWKKVSEKTQKRKGEDKTQTLIDTGQLRKSITYVVEKE